LGSFTPADAGGSIRIPAHFCGLAAIKPTSGRVPRTGQFPMPLGARRRKMPIPKSLIKSDEHPERQVHHA
jgi:hypothetical protein